MADIAATWSRVSLFHTVRFIEFVEGHVLNFSRALYIVIIAKYMEKIVLY